MFNPNDNILKHVNYAKHSKLMNHDFKPNNLQRHLNCLCLSNLIQNILILSGYINTNICTHFNSGIIQTSKSMKSDWDGFIISPWKRRLFTVTYSC